MNFLKFTLTRTLTFYILCFLIIWRILNYHEFINNAIPQALSRLVPPMDYFSEFVDRRDHYDNLKLMNCINYHQAVAHYFKYQQGEALAMLGFCSDRLGQESQAINDYQQSIKVAPDYFWPYYNLGVIYYNLNKYDKAAQYLQAAIEQNPIKTLILIPRSKVYTDVRFSKKTGGIFDIVQSVKQGRISAYVLLLNSLYKQGLYQQAETIALEGIKEDIGQKGIFYYFLGISLHMDGKEDLARMFLIKAEQEHAQGQAEIEQYLKSPRVRFL